MREPSRATESFEGAEPLFFGVSPDLPLFGWYHPPASGASPSAGVVICNPFGFEEVSAHRGIRALAMACAAQGLPCLRFDYLGCGNAALDADAENQFEGWLASVDAAIAALKQLAGVQRVVLVGFRLGAALAALRSAGRKDILGLVAVAPVVHGRRYLREQRLFSGAVETPGGAVDGAPMLEPGGFPIAPGTYAAIQSIDLAAPGAAASAGRILLIEDPLRVSDSLEWLERQRGAGASVDRLVIAGYDSLASDPQTAVVPEELFRRLIETVLQWVGSIGPNSGSRGAEVEGSEPAVHFGTSRLLRASGIFAAGGIASGGTMPCPSHPTTWVSERAVAIPASGTRLFGLLSEPATGAADRDILLLNAGAVPNIGPNRLWVALARSWAARGFRVLRLDFSGLGDSPTRTDGRDGDSYARSAVQEIAAALEFLRANRSGPCEAHLVGLCSGAYQALQGAIAGLPIRSATLINPLAFVRDDLGDRTRGALANYEVLALFEQYRRRLLTREFWSRLVRGEVDSAAIRQMLVRRLRFSLQIGGQTLGHWLRLRASSDLSHDLESVMRRGMQLNFVFAVSDPGYDLLRRRVRNDMERLLAQDRFRLECVGNADHTFTTAHSRRALLATLDGFEHFEPAGADA